MRAQDPKRVLRDVGRKIAEGRVKRGLTQESLAEALERSVQYASRVEMGENLSISTLTKVANAIGVSVISLFEAPTEEPRSKRGRPRKPAGPRGPTE